MSLPHNPQDGQTLNHNWIDVGKYVKESDAKLTSKQGMWGVVDMGMVSIPIGGHF